MGIKETIAAWFLIIVFLIFVLGAIGDIPIEIRKLRESIDKLVDELRRNRE